MRINNNILSMNVNRNLERTGLMMNRAAEKLSSGFRINRSADDAAGLAISEKMRAQIRGLSRAARNAMDGISLAQIAEGALQSIQDMLQRSHELAIMAASDTQTAMEREIINLEITQLKKEIDEVAKTTKFNDINIFKTDDGGGSSAASVSEYKLIIDLNKGICEVISLNETESEVADKNGIGDGFKKLADKIANEYFPNAISQIFDAFPALKAKVGSDKVEMNLKIEKDDGPGGTLAFASAKIGGGKAFDMFISVDSEDFSDNSLGDNSAIEKLESTLAHELMHSVMQYTFPNEMIGGFPLWFVEGTAQLTGGGFPTNWNYELEQIADTMGSANDASKDAAVEAYLKKYDVAGRPYGHGYLAAAYLGYKAGGGGVNADTIARGMNKIFADIIGGKTLYNALADNTGLTITNDASVEALFDNPSADMVSFMRQLAYNTKGGSNNGAGSVIAGALNVGGANIIGDDVKENQAFYVVGSEPGAGATGGLSFNSDYITLQIGAEDGHTIDFGRSHVDTASLGLTDTNVLTREAASAAITDFREAIDKVSLTRSYFGAVQNRLEYKINNLNNTIENLQNAESQIRDTDMANAMADFVKYKILQQVGFAMAAQVNSLPKTVLQLLNI